MNQLNKLNQLTNIPTVKLTTLEIAEVTGKRHSNILRDITNMFKNLSPNSDMEAVNPKYKYVASSYIDASGKSNPMLILNERTVMNLMMGYSAVIRDKAINLIEEQQEAIELLQARDTSVELQKEAMQLLHLTLPDEEKGESINYIKANIICNKATSNYFGMNKMVKKAQMSAIMLVKRDEIMDTYVKMFNLMGSATGIKTMIYSKYVQPSLAIT